MAHGWEIKSSLPFRSRYALLLMLHERKSQKILRNFYRSWKLLGWKSTVKENIFGSEFRDKKIIPDAIRSKAIIQNRPSKNGLPVHGQ